MPKHSKPKTTRNAVELPESAYDRVPRVQITLTDETCWLTRFDNTGKPNTTYPALTADIARAFNIFGASTGLLPPDILFWSQVGQQMRLGIWLPPAVRELHFDLGKRKQTKMQVPLPGMVFVGHGNKYFIFAMLERPARDHATLFVAPLPNVHSNDGSICAGNVKFPQCGPNTIHAAAQMFFESAFNHDLSSDKIADMQELDDEFVNGDDDDDVDPMSIGYEDAVNRRAERHPQHVSLYQFLRSIEGANEFPNEALVPMRQTIGQIIGGNHA